MDKIHKYNSNKGNTIYVQVSTIMFKCFWFDMYVTKQL